MPDFLPFAGLRYRDGEDLNLLCAPPYDVIDSDEREALASRSLHNAVRLILPTGDEPYAKAARDLTEWQASGLLARDPTPRFYGYRMHYSDETGRSRTTTGVIGALVLPRAAGEGDVLPHERTLPKAKSDRLALLRATRANLDPIWGLTAGNGLAGPLANTIELAECTDEDGVHHVISAVDDSSAIDLVRSIVGSAPLVLADGHHRFETAIAYRDEQTQAGISVIGDEAVMCLVVELDERELWVQPIHRLFTGTPSADKLRDRLRPSFTIVEAGPNDAESIQALERSIQDGNSVGLVERDRIARLVPVANELSSVQDNLDPAVRDVPSAWFEGLTATVFHGAQPAYQNDAQTVASHVNSGGADTAILLPPVTVYQIRTAALARVRMPQKTSFFAPKPRTGMVFRSNTGQ